MKEFDYKRAWAELAKPAFDALPQNVRDLYERVCVEAEGLNQLPNLEMPWPKGSDLRIAFREVPTEWLAQAARVIYFYGHWSPSGHSYKGGGGTWKFSHYADQDLRERLGKRFMPEGQPIPMDSKGNGVSLRIIEGVIRVCVSTRNSWFWDEVEIATEAGYERADKLKQQMTGQPEHEQEKRLKAYVVEHGLKIGAWDWDTKRFMVGPETSEEKEQRLTAKWAGKFVGPYKAERVQTLFDPHPFMIGQQHFPKDGGMYIRPEQAPCAMRDCGKAHTEHKASLTLLIRVSAKLQGMLPEDLQQQLVVIKDEATADGIEGFGFLEPGRS